MSTIQEKWELEKEKLNNLAEKHRKAKARFKEIEDEKIALEAEIPLIEKELSHQNAVFVEIDAIYDKEKNAAATSQS